MNASMSNLNLAARLLSLSRACIYTLMAVLPVWFLPTSLDPLEVSKQTLFVVLSLVATLAWLGSMMAARAFTLRRGWFNLLPVLLFVAVAASAFASSAPYLSWIGSGTQQYTSVLTAFAGALLVYVMVNTFTDEATHRRAHMALLAGAGAVAVVGLLSWFGGTGVQTFNTIGTINAFGIYLAVLGVFASTLFVVRSPDVPVLPHGVWGKIWSALAVLTALAALFVLAILDYWVLWTVLLFGIGSLCVFAFVRPQDLPGAHRFVLPGFMGVVALIFLVWSPRLINLNLPVEITPSGTASWTLARHALEGEQSLVGSGPGTFAFLYGQEKDVSVNTTGLWDTRFDRASSFALTILATLGFIGSIAWLIFMLTVSGHGIRALLGAKDKKEWLSVLPDVAGWFVLLAAACLYNANMTIVFLIFAFAGLTASQLMGPVRSWNFTHSPRAGLTASVSFVLLATFLTTGLFVAGRRAIAEAAYAGAVELDRSGAPLTDVVMQLDRAATMDRFDDAYYRALAHVLLLRVGEELSDLTSIDTVSTGQRDYVQALTGASVNAAVRATELSPENALNWLQRGTVYREFMPVIANAGPFALEAFVKAAELEPTNPSIQTEIGLTYLAVAEAARPLLATEDEAIRTTARQEVDVAVANAAQAFEQAVKLKADYAPAHFQLAIAYERQGRLAEAIGKMESVKKYNAFDIGVSFELGLLYLRRGEEGDLARSKAEFERTIQLAPAYSNAHWFLASIYEQEGNLAAAAEQVEAVLSYNPDNALVKARLDRLIAGQVSPEIPETLESEPEPVVEVLAVP